MMLTPGWCKLLSSYMFRLNSNTLPVCSLYGISPYDTNHATLGTKTLNKVKKNCTIYCLKNVGNKPNMELLYYYYIYFIDNS